MAYWKTKDELTCSICLNLYTDPVSLRCGDTFCHSCIVQVLDAQDGSRGYSCPDCRPDYLERPALVKNTKVGNIAECIRSTLPDMVETGILCTRCKESPLPAVKSCLHCETSLCDDHLTTHNKAFPHNHRDRYHKLVEPTSCFANKICLIHKNRVLEYYCPQDNSFLCEFCRVLGNHNGHQTELLEEASEKKKNKLRKYLDELNPKKAEIRTRVQNLQDHKTNVQEKASDKRENVSKTFMDIKKQLEMAEKKALSEISRQEEKIVSQISDLIRRLEIKEDELSRKMCRLEEMCHATDSIRLLQERDITVCGHGDGEDTGGDEGKIKEEDDLNEALISLTLHRSMRDIITNVTSQLWFGVPDRLLDEDTDQ